MSFNDGLDDITDAFREALKYQNIKEEKIMKNLFKKNENEVENGSIQNNEKKFKPFNISIFVGAVILVCFGIIFFFI